jgi:hypothetical protein
MRITNAEKNTADLLSSEHDSVLPRMAHVVAVDGQMVQVRFAGEAVAGETWFVSAMTGNPVGSTGVVHQMRGNAGYFQPVAIALPMKPVSKRGVQSLATNRTTAGDIDFTNVPTAAIVTGLLPNTVYQVTVDVFIAMTTPSTGSFRPVVKWPTGGTEQLSGFTPPLTVPINVHPWKWTGEITSNPDGEIAAMPSARWVSGSITSSRAELVLRVEPI